MIVRKRYNIPGAYAVSFATSAAQVRAEFPGADVIHIWSGYYTVKNATKRFEIVPQRDRWHGPPVGAGRDENREEYKHE